MAELSVSRKNIYKLLTEMQNKKYIIPEYQRPYNWDVEKCETLWSDIVSFFEEKTSGQEYFLGTIVTFKSETDSSEVEVIDGQQRITSLFLLLRAFYASLELMSDGDNVRGLKSQIAPCIWDVNLISTKVEDISKIHLESRVSTAEDNDILQRILSAGNVVGLNEKSQYVENFKFFLEKCGEYAKTNPLKWETLCVAILHSCIVLPIDCEKEDTALTIFNTLNDRGMPLSDSDIFKAQIYKHKPQAERKEFADRWKDLREKASRAKIDLDQLFRFYSHYIRAINKDKSKEIGLRKFYAENKYEKLKNSELIGNIESLCQFWDDLNNFKTGGFAKLSIESLRFVHCLQNYPNDYWKYLVSVYYLRYRSDVNFEINFVSFLKKVVTYLFVKFIEKPTVNVIRDDAFQAMIDLWTNVDIKFPHQIGSQFSNQIEHAHQTKIARGLILLHAYLNTEQVGLIPIEFETEHIFPRKWQNTNYNGWTIEDAQMQLERFGNKVAIEEKLNIQAGNGYFGNKKIKYAKSTIANVVSLSRVSQNDWQKEDIEVRNKQFVDSVTEFFIANS